MAHFNACDLSALILLMIIISECRGSLAPVSATLGEDIRLPCSIPTRTGLESYRLELTKHSGHPAQPKVILARPKGSKFPDGENVRWGADEKGGMSAFLTAVKRSDEGLYRCQISRGWDVVSDQSITLKVKECNILNPVKAALNSVATLHCPYDTTPGHIPDVSWAFLKGGQEVSILEDDDRLQTNGSSLVISPVKDSDGGWYRCKYLAGQRQHCSESLLKVQDAVITTTVIVSETPQVKPEPSDQELEEEVTSVAPPSTIRILAVSVIAMVTVTSALMVGMAIYHRHKTQKQRRESLGSNTRRGADTRNSVPVVNDENCPPASRSELSCTYQSLNPNTMEHNTEYESIAVVVPPASRSELNSSYQSLNPNTMEHNTKYESIAVVSKGAEGAAAPLTPGTITIPPTAD